MKKFDGDSHGGGPVCNHQRDALGEIHNQTSIVRTGRKFLRPGVRGLGKADLRRDMHKLEGMLVMYERVFGYGHGELRKAKQECETARELI